MKKTLFILVTTFLLLSQSIQVDMVAPRLIGIDRLSLNDFGFLRSTRNELFRANIRFTGFAERVDGLVIHFTLTKDGKKLLSIKTEKQSGIKPQLYSIKNTDFTTNISYDLVSGGKVDVKFTGLEWDESFIQGDLNAELPGGHYQVIIKVVAKVFGRDITGDKSFDFNVIKRTKVNLIAPRGSVVSTTPVFIWNGSQTYKTVTLYVVEDKGDWQRSRASNPLIKAEVTGKSSFRFPTGTDRSLEDGKSYFWAIVPSMRSISGIAELRKNMSVYHFKVNLSREDKSLDPKIIGLKKLVGSAYMELEKELMGFKVIKSEIRNGDGSLANDKNKAMVTIMNAVRSGKYKINVKID